MLYFLVNPLPLLCSFLKINQLKIFLGKLDLHTVHGVLKAGILKWFAIPFSQTTAQLHSFHTLAK